MDAATQIVDTVAEATGTAGDRSAVISRILDRYTAALRLDGEIGDPSQTAALLVWSLFSPLGTLPEGAMVGPTSRAWYEELRLAPVVADALRARGLDEQAAWWAAERVRTLLDLPIPSWFPAPEATLPLRLIDAWLSHPAARPFLRVNAWEGAEWFHRESFDELLAWVDRLEWIMATEDARAPRREPGSARMPSGLEATLTAAADASGYRVDTLRAALGAAEPAPVVARRTAGEPRAPRPSALAPVPAPDPAPVPETEPVAAPEPEPVPAASRPPKPGKVAKPVKASKADKADKARKPAKTDKAKKPGKK